MVGSSCLFKAVTSGAQKGHALPLALLAFVRGGPGTWQKSHKRWKETREQAGRPGASVWCQRVVPARGLTSREGAVHTGPDFPETGPGVRPQSAPLREPHSALSCCFSVFAYVLSSPYPSGDSRFPPTDLMSPPRFPFSINATFSTKQFTLQGPATRCLLRGKTFPGTHTPRCPPLPSQPV